MWNMDKRLTISYHKKNQHSMRCYVDLELDQGCNEREMWFVNEEDKCIQGCGG